VRRHALSAATAALAAMVLLAGCGSPADDPSDTTTDQQNEQPATGNEDDAAALAAVSLSGEAGEAPEVDFEAPLVVSAPTSRLVSEGNGEEVGAEDNVTLHLVVFNGADGTEVSSTYGNGPDALFLGDPTIYPEIVDVLVGGGVGSRSLFAIPAEGGGSTLMAFEVMGSSQPLERAEGTPVEPADGLPAITLDDAGEPSMTPVDGDAPTELVVQPLIEGDGEEVAAGQTVIVNYRGWLWDGEAFDSSWQRGAPFTFPVGQGRVIEGWDTGLQGQPVGSQLLLVIPPDLGYGDEDTASIPGGSTLVFVVDILAAD